MNILMERMQIFALVFVYVSSALKITSVNSITSHGKLRVLNDVCMVAHTSGCNSFGNEREFLLPRQLLDARTTVILKKYEGVSAFITAKHSTSYDWTNYEHWGEASILFAELAYRHAAEIKAKLPSNAPLKLTNIVLPQINVPQRDCGLAKSHGIQALRGRGGFYSEVYVALARAAVLPLQSAGVMVGNSTGTRPSVRFCRQVQPIVRQSHLDGNATKEKKGVACFQSIIETRPDTSHRVKTFRNSLEPKIREPWC